MHARILAVLGVNRAAELISQQVIDYATGEELDEITSTLSEASTLEPQEVQTIASEVLGQQLPRLQLRSSQPTRSGASR